MMLTKKDFSGRNFRQFIDLNNEWEEACTREADNNGSIDTMNKLACPGYGWCERDDPDNRRDGIEKFVYLQFLYSPLSESSRARYKFSRLPGGESVLERTVVVQVVDYVNVSSSIYSQLEEHKNRELEKNNAHAKREIIQDGSDSDTDEGKKDNGNSGCKGPENKSKVHMHTAYAH